MMCTCACFTNCDMRLPLASAGTMRSESPWMTSVGTLIVLTSGRKSSSQASTHFSIAPYDEPAAMKKLEQQQSSN